ncbi:2-amino-4-hydroxy-6-hydroxymethyldihydropteridinediphosphokinase [Pseudidiomarina planktonica]|uniref:2-amino-4-hydroxy-6-hydroxymethyldihydropteridine pyrophosphokinase n=1 Tax=Pseudidiomarina planktonica TaxID=1323738 RepID=A0A1Y6EVJ2_9GAMM|nr:2-amino-4-hydroxy-6-hydroxymethyldihydropteridine diphosphokinase [Pseudidiomarina planktonica]RUO65145.1 2-amino-4-hydroxy-6-hydroxymethyldihydropteridine diphosphokinase [Pseudidiomarina planktonica]SMQ66296.1 2-amino-4-hydroxy-6-hydroxymethyldihydropteridinediphosphokinase [Pseudidiomarina planktonica]
MTFYYLCSLGSNIAPEYNISRAKSYLAGIAQEVHYSRVITTEPVAMNSDNEFLNALFVVQTHLPADRLKQAFNTIEISLGRDRSDPDCSIKDRPIDIDILGTISSGPWPEVPDYLVTLKNEFQQQYEVAS